MTSITVQPVAPAPWTVHARNHSQTMQDAGPLSGSEPVNMRSRRDRPCDACRRRKSRCVIHEGADACVLCLFHHQDCTFVESPQPRKRRASNAEEPAKKRAPSPEKNLRTSPMVEDYANLKGPSLLKQTLGLQNHRHSRYIGATNEFEAVLTRLSPFNAKDEYQIPKGILRKVSESHTFLMLPDQGTQNHDDESADLDAIEGIVAPHGQALINLYFRIVHPSFPILHKKVYLEKYNRTHREFSPPLLAAVYILALNWWSYSSDLASLPKPDVKELERLALKTIYDVMHRPKLSTVQAGLLLLQRPEGDNWALTAQLVAVGQDLGLHLDCTNWKIPAWERGLRKRLAWGLFMQDKWGSLTHGRPSHIMRSNWAVQPVSEDDFPESAADEDDEEGSTEVEKGRVLFSQMISLTEILAEVLQVFYSVAPAHELEDTRSILEQAKPVQIRLKEWFSKLPPSMRVDSTQIRKLSSTGYLHLAYFVTEITLHRRIVRSLDPATTDPYLLHICRSAAKTRLISAMDFVNRLKPEHLQSFWYFASKVNFAVVGTFGCLLWATSPTREEAQFYKNRLGEYRWTLRVSSKGAEFMSFAVSILDSSTNLLKDAWSAPTSLASHQMPQGTPTSRRPQQQPGSPVASPMTTTGESNPNSGLASPSASSDSGGYSAYMGFDEVSASVEGMELDFGEGHWVPE